MELIAVKEKIEDNKIFINDPDCQDSIYMSVEYFKKIGYDPPWIGYYVKLDDELVGSAAFKGKPINGQVEIAYSVFPKHRQKGIASKIAGTLVQLSLKTDPSIIITAKTLPEENYSTRVLRKNNFKFLGAVMDEEDGIVWEWEYEPKLI